jgi:hypothetical protein
MLNEREELKKQAIALAHYLIKSRPKPDSIKLYTKAVRSKLPKHLDKADLKILKLSSRHPSLLASLDAGLAILRPDAELRRRIYIMFAVLESTPEHSDRFLSKKRSRLYIFRITGIGCRASMRSLVGMFLVKVLEA